MADETIRIQLDIEPKPGSLQNAERGLDKLEKSLRDVEEQANRTKERFDRITEVAGKVGIAGAAITAPFLLALQKYQASAKDTEATSRRLADVNQRFEEAQIRIGRVVAEQVAPALETAAGIAERIAGFIERNPELVAAALGIGGTLVTLAGVVATTAQIVSTISAVQGLAAAFGVGGAGAAAVGTGGAAAAAGSAAALSAAVSAGIAAAAPAVIGALALAVGANVGKFIAEALIGREITWKEIGDTLGKMLIIVAQGWDYLFDFFGADTDFAGATARAVGIPLAEKDQREAARASTTLSAIAQGNANVSATLQNLGAVLSFGFDDIGNAIVNGFQQLFGGGKAMGGYADYGLYKLGDSVDGGRGAREFILSGETTRAAESLIGGSLTQGNIVQAIVNAQLSNGMTYKQARTMISDLRGGLIDSMIGVL